MDVSCFGTKLFILCLYKVITITKLTLHHIPMIPLDLLTMYTLSLLFSPTSRTDMADNKTNINTAKPLTK